jgi:hypothetical protein
VRLRLPVNSGRFASLRQAATSYVSVGESFKANPPLKTGNSTNETIHFPRIGR